MTPCPHCGAYVTEGRTICKACGRDINKPLGSPAEVPATTPPIAPSQKIPAWGIVACVIAGLILTVGVFSSNRNRAAVPARTNSNGDPIAAYVACKDFVGNHLKAPTQAEWPLANEADIVTLGGGAWRVTSYVDAPNALGVMLRNDYTCEIKLTPGRWEGRKLIFGGEQVYP